MSSPIPVGTLVAPSGLPGSVGDLQTGPGLKLDTTTVPITIDVATPYLPIAGGQITGSLGIGINPPAGAVNALIAGGVGAQITASNYAGNAYFDGSQWRYLANGAAWLFGAGGGSTSWGWLYGGTGSAGGVASFTTIAMTLNGTGDLNARGSVTAPTHMVPGGGILVGTNQTTWPGGIALTDGTNTYGFSMQASTDPAYQWYRGGFGILMTLDSQGNFGCRANITLGTGLFFGGVAGNGAITVGAGPTMAFGTGTSGNLSTLTFYANTVYASNSLVCNGFSYPAGGAGFSQIQPVGSGGWSWGGGQGGYTFQHFPEADPVFRFTSGSTMLFYINSDGSIAARNSLNCGNIGCYSINTNGNTITLGTLSASGNINGHDFVVNGTGVYYVGQGNGGYYQARWDGSSFYYWVNNYGYLGPLFTPSGRAVKRDIRSVDGYDALAPICAIPFYAYDAPEAGKPIDDEGNWTGIAHHELGWIAEDLEELIPNSVVRLKHQSDTSQPDVLGPQWMPILTYAVRAIQQLSQHNTALETRLAALEGRS